MDNLRNVSKPGCVFPPVHKEEGAGTLYSQILYLFNFPTCFILQVFFQVWSPRPPHEETHLNISQLGMDVTWAKCCEMKVELKLQCATLQEKRTWSRVILCTETTRSHCHTPNYTSNTCTSRTLILYALPQLDGRRCRRGNGIEVKSMRRNNRLQYFVPLGFVSCFCQWKSKKIEETSLQVDGSRRGLFNLLLSATQ